MNPVPGQTWCAVAVGGKVVGPCGIAKLLVVHESEPSMLVPLDSDSPAMAMDDLEEAAARGLVTLLRDRIPVGSNHLAGWASPELLRASNTITKIWAGISVQSTHSTRFVDDQVREVQLAPEQSIRDVFVAIEDRIPKDYLDSCLAVSQPSELLEVFEPALYATLYTATYKTRRRRNILNHLGHLYLINNLQMKLKQLHRLEVGSEYGDSYQEFWREVRLIHDGLEVARRFRTDRDDNLERAARLRSDWRQGQEPEAEVDYQGSHPSPAMDAVR